MDNKTIHDKAIRLCEGDIVEIEGNWFRLVRFSEYFDDNACMECELGSICKMWHVNICAKCEIITRKRCCLHLVTKR